MYPPGVTAKECLTKEPTVLESAGYVEDLPEPVDELQLPIPRKPMLVLSSHRFISDILKKKGLTLTKETLQSNKSNTSVLASI